MFLRCLQGFKRLSYEDKNVDDNQNEFLDSKSWNNYRATREIFCRFLASFILKSLFKFVFVIVMK